MFRASRPTFLAILLVAPALYCQEPQSRPTTRDDTRWEKGLERAARKLIATKEFQRQHKDLERANYGGSVRLRHSLLEKYFPDQRFYFVDLHIWHDKRAPHNLLHEYCLAILSTKNKAGIAYGRSELKSLDYLKASDVRARTQAQAAEVHELQHLLDSIGGGTCQSQTPISEQRIYKQFGLGFPKAEQPSRKRMIPKVVEAGSKRYAVTCNEHCDDWRMPVTLSYRMLTFDKETGKLLGITARKGKTFQHNEYSRELRDKEYAAFLTELAQEKG
jgi:hypothetical protein